MITNKPLIYLASPYRADNPDIRKLRFKMVSKAAGQLVAAGNLVYSPITHSAPMAHEARLDIGYEQWKELDEFYLSRCDIVIVLQLPGWEISSGIADEIAFADDLGKPVMYLPTVIDVTVIRSTDNVSSSSD